MKRLGILGVCLLAMAAPAAGGAQQPPPSDSQDSNAAEQAADPASENGATEAAPAAADDQAAEAPAAPQETHGLEPGFSCRPKGMIGRKYGPTVTNSLPNVPAHASATGAFGDVPDYVLPPC
jgi:hypothetical protein